MIEPARPTMSSDRLLREQVRLLFQHVPAMLAGAGVVSVVLAFSVRRIVGPWCIVAWLALILAVAMARVGLHHRFARVRAQEFDARRWARAYVTLSVVSGACWGASAFLIFPAGQLPVVALFLLVIVSLSTGSTVSHSSVRLAPIAWSGPAMLPYAARLVAEGGETAYAIAFLVVVYLLTIFRYSLTHHAAITSAIALRFENVDLLDQVREANARMRHDLEQRQKAEAALRAGELERQHLEAQLAQAQRIEAVGRLAGGVAHDYNNMLTVITGHAEMALMSAGQDSELRGDLEQILSAARRSADLTGQLLAFARRQPVKPRVLDLNAAVSGTISILKRLIGEDAALVWSPGPALWAIEIDPSQLDQILANLAVNARDAMAGTGTFRIETANVVFDDAFCAGHLGAVAGEYVRLTVSDTGSGISPEIVGRIFEPFFTTKPQGLGTGLGLSTVYGIVKQNRGFVTVESEVGRGATFAIALPRARAELSEPDGGSEPTRVP
jgi:signal transduction histidine kinase